MSKHLKKGCPLPISIIAKKRDSFLRQARELFLNLQIEGVDHIFIRNAVTARTLLYMDKYRNQTVLTDHLDWKEEQ